MANQERGEMTLVCGAQTFVLRLTTNACCELEARSGKTYEEHLRDWNKLHRVTAFRWLVWVCLQDQHAEVAKTPEMVGPILDGCDQKQVMKVMAAFIAMNNDEVKKLIAAGLLSEQKADPPRAQVDAGVDSTLTLVGSA